MKKKIHPDQRLRVEPLYFSTQLGGGEHEGQACLVLKWWVRLLSGAFSSAPPPSPRSNLWLLTLVPLRPMVIVNMFGDARVGADEGTS